MSMLPTLSDIKRLSWADVPAGFLMSAVSGVAIFTLGLAFSYLATVWTEGYVQSGSPDLLLDALPVLRLHDISAWGPAFVVTFAIMVLCLEPKLIPGTLKSVGLLYCLRSFFVILTPLGARSDRLMAVSNSLLERLAYNGNDFFFSGHVSLPFLLALLFWHRPVVRWIMLGAAALSAAAVLLAHAHYSIDVFAAPFMTFGVYSFARWFFPQDFAKLRRARGTAVRYTGVDETLAPLPARLGRLQGVVHRTPRRAGVGGYRDADARSAGLRRRTRTAGSVDGG